MTQRESFLSPLPRKPLHNSPKATPIVILNEWRIRRELKDHIFLPLQGSQEKARSFAEFTLSLSKGPPPLSREKGDSFAPPSSPGGAGDPPATSECRLDGGVQMEGTSGFTKAGFKLALGLKDEKIWRFTGAFSPDKTLAGGSPAPPGKRATHRVAPTTTAGRLC
jgi:hypothetical protein